MKTYIDVFFKCKFSRNEDFIDVLRSFSKETDDWQFLESKSEEYSSLMKKPSCQILKLDSKFRPAVAITNKCENIFYIANIISTVASQMSISEYNQVIIQLTNSLKTYLKQKKLSIRIDVTGEGKELRDIIPGRKLRELFEVYLNAYPTSYHPCDIRRLDTFICSLSRHAKKSIDLELLKNWLIDDKGWSVKDASWCIKRIRTGLEILKVRRGDYY